ncbi:MAG TPA: NAD(P)-dependent oxidoreductase [Candidatus Macondimonas sp.]|nr:NAD(P)-dependent oxidoreductase [Candidatus Macondimonas sp.]
MNLATGFIGLGAMGLPMARNLHRAGYLHAVWNRTASKALDLAAETGCISAADPVDLAQRCEVLVLCVSADDDVLGLVATLTPALRPGQIILDCSTVAPATARAAAEHVQACGADFLDCPVSGGVEGARQGSLVTMVGGESAPLEHARPVLAAMTRQITWMGPVGAGQATKAVNQIMAAGIAAAVTEALALGAAAGLPLARVIEVVSGGAAGNWFLNQRGPTMIRDRFETGFKIALHDKDLAICQQLAADCGGELPLVKAVRDDYAALIAAGFGGEDISALYRRKRALFGNSAPTIVKSADAE